MNNKTMVLDCAILVESDPCNKQYKISGQSPSPLETSQFLSIRGASGSSFPFFSILLRATSNNHLVLHMSRA